MEYMWLFLLLWVKCPPIFKGNLEEKNLKIIINPVTFINKKLFLKFIEYLISLVYVRKVFSQHKKYYLCP